MKSYSMDLRERVLKASDAGSDAEEVAELFSVRASWVRRLEQRRRAAGGDGVPTPKPSRNRRARKLAAYADRIRALIAATPDLTLAEIRRELGVAVALATVWAAVARLALTVKKVRRAAEQDRPDVKRKLDEWMAARPALDPARLVFVDETWASTDMSRTPGRSPRGERLVCPVPHGHWTTTTTFVAALRADGLTAPMVIDGAMTGDLFVAYVEQCWSRRCGRGTWW